MIVTRVPLPGVDSMCELVRQPACAAEAEAQADARREAVLQRELDVGDARALVDERQPQPRARARRASCVDLDVAAAAVDERVARELARRGDDLRLVDEAEAERDRTLAHDLAHPDDVLGPAQRHASTCITVAAALRIPERTTPRSRAIAHRAQRLLAAAAPCPARR